MRKTARDPRAILLDWLVEVRRAPTSTASIEPCIRVGRVWLTPEEALDASAAAYLELRGSMNRNSDLGATDGLAAPHVIRGVATNRYRARAVDQLRRRERALVTVHLPTDLDLLSPELDPAQEVADRDDVLRAYAQLDARGQRLALLRGMGVPFRAAARSVELAEPTARKRMSRFAATLSQPAVT